MILAIDNGLTGALAVLSPCIGLPPVFLTPLPVMKANLYHRGISRDKASGRKAKAKVKSATGNEIDAVALKAIITNLGVNKITAVIFEDCPEHGDRASTLRSMAGSAAKIMAVLELCGLAGSTFRIQSHTWQGPMLGKVPTGETKAYALAAAVKLWPEQDWRGSIRCTTPHTGFVDAALIGHWALLNIPGLRAN